ncbi:MAG TPA: acyl-CoA thioesterase domain-containing protein [Vicinamibacterales bacterium]|nr:acyl-CoA thioesterase domain-containing protein [Vicinamibacterales bacterium]
MDSSDASPDTLLWGEADFGRLMHVEAGSDDVLRSVLNEDNGIGMVFGGQMLGLSLMAASRTVPHDRPARNLQITFVRPGKVSDAIEFRVDPMLDGRRASTRLVRLVQGTKVLGAGNISFQVPESGLERAEPVPDYEPPEALVDVCDLVRATPSVQHGYGLATISRKLGVEFRLVRPEAFVTRRREVSRFQFWMRLRRPIADDLRLHQAAILYLTDWLMAFAPVLPLWSMGEAQRMPILTLNHDAWFYHPFRADDWLLVDVEGPVLQASRGVSLANIYVRSGERVAMISQESFYPSVP